MRFVAFRLLAFVPPATAITAALFASTSSFMLTLETSVTSDRMTVHVIRRFESVCDVLSRENRQISRAATNCDADLQCLGSPILCPITMDVEEELGYRRLRAEFGRECRLSSGLRENARSGPHRESASCGLAFDGSPSDASEGSIGRGIFVF